jgi:hypothetical protein
VNRRQKLINQRVVGIMSAGLAQRGHCTLRLTQARAVQGDSQRKARAIQSRRLEERCQHADRHVGLPELAVPARELHAQPVVSEQHRAPCQAHGDVQLTAPFDQRARQGRGDQAFTLDVALSFRPP